MKKSHQQQNHEWEMIEGLMLILRLIKWAFFALCAWYVIWLLK